jgi:hypothetical protein
MRCGRRPSASTMTCFATESRNGFRWIGDDPNNLGVALQTLGERSDPAAPGLNIVLRGS